MSQEPQDARHTPDAEDAAFAAMLDGLTGNTPRRSGGRRGLFGWRRRATGTETGTGTDTATGLDPGADVESGPGVGGAHRSPPHGVPVGPPSGPRPGMWRPDVGPVPPPGPWPPRPGRPAPRYPEPDRTPPTGPGPGIGRREWQAPEYPDGPRTSEPPESSFVRPYAWTRGRTRPAYALAVETLLSTTATGRDPARVTQYEHRTIADLCAEPRSVAEVAALLSLPLGVARVLLGDMAAHGTIVVHETASPGTTPDVALMERVLSGLRRL